MDMGNSDDLWSQVPTDPMWTLKLKVYVALRGRNSGMFILSFMDMGNSDDWWSQVPMDPRWTLKYM